VAGEERNFRGFPGVTSVNLDRLLTQGGFVSSLSFAGKRPVLADLVPGSLVRDIALVAGGAVLTGAAAQLTIPVPGSPVPMTGQTFAALLVGASLGMSRGAASMLVYLLVGAVVPARHRGPVRRERRLHRRVRLRRRAGRRARRPRR
jgi:hypothetical protein